LTVPTITLLPSANSTIRHLDDVLRIIHVVLGEVAVSPVDTALEIDFVGGHVIRADLVVDAGPTPANGSDP